MTNSYNVLFICSGNSARSIMAEAILNREREGRFRAYSAGSRPRDAVNPIAAAVLGALGYDTAQLRAKSWDEFAAPGAPEMDFVFTVCDEAAGETCPVWPGHPASAHWGMPDPAKATGHPAEVQLAFDDASPDARQPHRDLRQPAAGQASITPPSTGIRGKSAGSTRSPPPEATPRGPAGRFAIHCHSWYPSCRIEPGRGPAGSDPTDADRKRWNDATWAEVWPKRERFTATVTPMLIAALALQPGERVLDIGCGGGSSFDPCRGHADRQHGSRDRRRHLGAAARVGLAARSPGPRLERFVPA